MEKGDRPKTVALLVDNQIFYQKQVLTIHVMESDLPCAAESMHEVPSPMSERKKAPHKNWRVEMAHFSLVPCRQQTELSGLVADRLSAFS